MTPGDFAKEYGYGSQISRLTAAVQARDDEWAERERVAFSAEYKRAERAEAKLRIAREALAVLDGSKP